MSRRLFRSPLLHLNGITGVCRRAFSVSLDVCRSGLQSCRSEEGHRAVSSFVISSDTDCSVTSCVLFLMVGLNQLSAGGPVLL